MAEQQEISEEQAEQLVRSMMEQKETPHSFFTRVIKHPDSTKIGNLDIEELGVSTHPVRTYKELALFCDKICDDGFTKEYYEELSEIQLATSLSKEGFLIKQVGTRTQQYADTTNKQKSKVKKGFFKKENKEE